MTRHLAAPAIEVIAVDTPAGPAAKLDATSEPAVRTVMPWVAMAAALTALAAMIGALVWWQHRAETGVSFVRETPARAAAIDASGCPVGLECETDVELANGLQAALIREFPTAVVVDTDAVVISANGKPVRNTATLRTRDGVLVTVTAQCVPHGAVIPRRRGPVPPVGPADGLLVVPGAPGCSVAVTAHAPAHVFVPIRAMEELAYDPAVQLQP
jgi:hypothetical protein